MANKLYEESSIEAIAEKIRQFSTYNKNRTYVVGQMAQGVQDACQDQYQRGLDSGFTDGELSGANKVKTEEARSEANVTHSVSKTSATVTIPSGYYAEEVKKVLNVQDGDLDLIVDTAYDDGLEAGYNNGYDSGFADGELSGVNKVKTEEARDYRNISYDVYVKEVEVNVDAGYYPQETVVNVDVQSVYDEGHTEGYDNGYTEGYNDGLADGGGGGSSDVDEMMLLDEWHAWEGEPPFYSYYKYLYYETSNLSSDPVVVSLENGNESKYLHVYIYAFLNGSGVGGNDEEAFYTVVLPPADEAHDWYSFDSLEINSPCFEVQVWGIRWSDDGV